MESFGEKLKKLRESKGLSQAELAKELFVTRSAVAKWEQDRGFPSIDSLRQISTLFEVSIDDLVSDKEIEILEVTANKKLRVRTKLLIALSVFLAIIMIAGIVLASMYCPRKLSNYLKIEPNEISCIYVERFKENANMGGGYYDIFDRIELDKSEYEEFLTDLKNIKISPKYKACKCSSYYCVYIKVDKKEYCINGLSATILSEKIDVLVLFKNNKDSELFEILNKYNLIFN